LIGRLVRTLKRLPPVLQLRRLRHARDFWRSTAVRHHGVYGSFAEAAGAVPDGAAVGWDNAPAARMFASAHAAINPRDYPVLFWLQRLWQGPLTVFDYGGHSGLKRYAFEKYLDFDAAKRWIVCDVPEVIAEGRRIAAWPACPSPPISPTRPGATCSSASASSSSSRRRSASSWPASGGGPRTSW
jgi:hypothetical protein